LTLIKALGSVTTDLSASFDYSRQFFSSPSFTKAEGRNVLVNGLIEKSGLVKPPLAENQMLRDYALFLAAELEKGIKESPSDYRYYNSLTNLYNFLGQVDSAYFEKSEEISRQALEIFSRDITFLIKIFAIRFHFDDLDGAEAAIKEVLAKAPNSHLGRWNMALIHYRRQDFESARREAETAISSGYAYAGNLVNYNFLASIYFNLKDYAKAITYFMEAYKLFPSDLQLIADIAVTYYRMGDTAKAREWILKIMEISPGSADEVNKFLRLISD
jgi:tetratricopeptide (TPR) repeat protein